MLLNYYQGKLVFCGWYQLFPGNSCYIGSCIQAGKGHFMKPSLICLLDVTELSACLNPNWKVNVSANLVNNCQWFFSFHQLAVFCGNSNGFACKWDLSGMEFWHSSNYYYWNSTMIRSSDLDSFVVLCVQKGTTTTTTQCCFWSDSGV